MAKHFASTVLGNGPGLLLAHGGGGSVAANFGGIIGDLARTHTVVGADYPGSGETPRSPVPLVLDELADELVGIALGNGLDEFSVLGYSLGTAVAVRAAVRHPGRVNGLVLTSGFATVGNRLRLATSVWATLLEGERDLLARFMALVGVGERALDALSPPELAATLDALAEGLPEGTPEQVALVTSVDIRADLAEIRVPTTVIATTLDTLAPPSLSRELAAGISGAELVEIEAGHNIGFEAGAEWLAAIRKLLDRVG
ncbi:alpha/beta hydrolase [Saccharomonospora sp. NPDC006951]